MTQSKQPRTWQATGKSFRVSHGVVGTTLMTLTPGCCGTAVTGIRASCHGPTSKSSNLRLEPFTDGDDPDIVFDRHSHFAVGFVDGISLRTMKPDGTMTEAFKAFCQIMEDLEAYPVLDESLFSEMEYQATLENYGSEMWRLKDTLPAGWQSQVYSYFSDNGKDRYIESRDDTGGWAPREVLVDALIEIGLFPPEADEPVMVER